MKTYELPIEELQGLKAAHKTSKQVSAYTAYRIHVIILLGMGMTPAEVSEIILLNEDTVRTYFDKYVSGGLVKLLETSYQGSNKKLTAAQIKQLQDELDKHVYLNTKSVCRFVNLEFDVEYSERGMASLLNNIGYVSWYRTKIMIFARLAIHKPSFHFCYDFVATKDAIHALSKSCATHAL